MSESMAEISLDYFLVIFEEVLNIKEMAAFREKDSEEDVLKLSEDKQLQVFNDSFYEILIKYLSLTNNQSIIVPPENPIALFSLILSDAEDNSYKHSLLTAAKYIMARYLEILGKGYPTLTSNDEETKEKSFKIVHDSEQRIISFDSTNMTLEEQSDTMLKVLRNVIENTDEEIPYVEYVDRTDI